MPQLEYSDKDVLKQILPVTFTNGSFTELPVENKTVLSTQIPNGEHK